MIEKMKGKICKGGAMGRGKTIGGRLSLGLRDLSSFADRSSLSFIVSFRILSFTSAIASIAKLTEVRDRKTTCFVIVFEVRCVFQLRL